MYVSHSIGSDHLPGPNKHMALQTNVMHHLCLLPPHSAVKISFDQTTYTAYASQNAPLKLLKEGRIRQNISVDVTFSDDSLFQTILFKPSQNVIEVSFNPGGETQSYSLSLALAEPSHNLEGLVVMGAPAEVKVMEFTPEGRRIIRLLEGKINSTVVERQNEYSRLQEKYAVLQRRVEDLQGTMPMYLHICCTCMLYMFESSLVWYECCT